MRRTSLIRVLLLGAVLTTGRPAAADPSPVVSEAVVPAPIEAVWRAYTTREEIEAWMVPSSSEYALRIGGAWLTSYDESSNLDDETVIHNEVLAFDPGTMLAVRTVETPADFPFPNAILDTWTVLYLDPVDGGHTKVTTKMFGFNDTPESKEMRAFFEWGNAYELDKLVEHFSTR